MKPLFYVDRSVDRSVNWSVKLKFEYWKWWWFYVPLAPVALWQMIRARSTMFFTAINPSFDETSGAMGESKKDILALIPPEYLPAQLVVAPNTPFENVLAAISASALVFPMVAKPDVGERGINVAKVSSLEELRAFMAGHKKEFLLQEFISYPLEYAVFYVRLPDSPTGRVTSVSCKGFLTVVGDGKATIRELMQRTDRARMQIARFQAQQRADLTEVLPAGEARILEPIGNHNRGTAFLDHCHLITPALHAAFDRIATRIPDFYYGRFDLKTATEQDLCTLENLRIMELNGVGAEPAHIYAPDGNFFRAYRSMVMHWQLLGTVAIQNRRRGVPAMGAIDFYRKWRRHMSTRELGA